MKSVFTNAGMNLLAQAMNGLSVVVLGAKLSTSTDSFNLTLEQLKELTALPGDTHYPLLVSGLDYYPPVSATKLDAGILSPATLSYQFEVPANNGVTPPINIRWIGIYGNLVQSVNFFNAYSDYVPGFVVTTSTQNTYRCISSTPKAWKDTLEYNIDATVRHGKIYYKATQASGGSSPKNPETNPTHWKEMTHYTPGETNDDKDSWGEYWKKIGTGITQVVGEPVLMYLICREDYYLTLSDGIQLNFGIKYILDSEVADKIVVSSGDTYGRDAMELASLEAITAMGRYYRDLAKKLLI